MQPRKNGIHAEMCLTITYYSNSGCGYWSRGAAW